MPITWLRKMVSILIFWVVLYVSVVDCQHDRVADFEHFPRWFQDTFDDGFFVLGWIEGNSYGIFSFLEGSTSPGCSLDRKTGFHWVLNFESDDPDHRCIMAFRNGNKLKKVVLTESELPHPSCRDPSESFTHVVPGVHEPGERVVYCHNRTMFLDWYEFQANSTGCFNVFFRPTLKPCSEVAKTSRKLLAGCSVEIVKSKINQHSEVLVTTNTDGTIMLKSDTFMKTEQCNIECAIEVGDVKELTVTCPDGSQHHFNLEEDLRKRCWGIDVPYLRWISLLVCKSTYHPWLVVLFICWSLVAHLLYSMVCVFMSSLGQWFHRKIEKKVLELDPELGVCINCLTPVRSEREIKDHIVCIDGKCTYCMNTMTRSELPNHVKKCKENHDAIQELTISLNSTMRSMRFSRIMLKWSLNKFASQIFRWGGSLIIICLIFIPPTSSKVITNGQTSPNYMTHPVSDSSQDPEMIRLVKDSVSEGCPLVNFKVGYLEELKQELEMCGTGCFNEERRCNCPNLSWNSTLTRNEVFDIDVPETKHRDKRESKNNRKRHQSHHRQHHKNLIHGVSENFDKLKYFELSPRAHDQSATTNSSDSKQSTKYAELHQAASVLTNWGLLDITSSFEPADSYKNIDLTWNSYKKDKTNTYIKGSTTATLDLVKGNGIKYTLTSSESNEKLNIGTFIYDFSQKYSTKLKYVTADRKLYTWFRGACTGECPNGCGCDTNTCINKHWDYDRNLGCNPTWCWATNAGCSCCAADVDSRSSKWVLAVYEVRYEATEVLVCQTAGYDRFNCKVIDDNSLIMLDEFRFTYTKPRSVEYRLPDEIAVYWDIATKSKLKLSFPDGVLLNPEICDIGCNHGEPGDYKASNLTFLFETSGNEHVVETMTWQGVDIEHTCHFASWPDCDFYSIKKDITVAFDHLIEKSEKITDRFIPQRVIVHNNTQLELRVRPKSNAGNLDLTMQVKNLALKRQETKPIVTHFKLLKCQGCYGCASGFDCKFSVKLKSPNTFNIHLKSEVSYVTVSSMSYKVNAGSNSQTYSIKCFSILNLTEVSLYVEEAPLLKSTIHVALDEPSGLLVETNHYVGVSNAVEPECQGFGGAVVCTFDNMGRTASHLGTSIFGFFSSWYSAAKGLIALVVSLVVLLVTVKLVQLIKSIIKSSKTQSINPNQLVKRGTKKGK